MKTLSHDEYKDKVSKLKTLDDLNNFAKDLIAPVLQEMLEGEMDSHLGYPTVPPAETPGTVATATPTKP